MSGAAADERRAVGVRAAVITATATLGLWAWLGWAYTGPASDETTLAVVAETVVFLGLPFVVAAAAMAWHTARAAHGPDVAGRMLALATAGRHGTNAEWSVAMRAELASITNPRERRRFAVGCALTALRTGWGRVPLLVAAGFFVVSCVITLYTHDTVGWTTIGLVWLGHVTVTGAELYLSAASWSFEAELMDPRRRGEYQGAAALSGTLGKVWAPALYTFLAMSWGAAGWLVIATIVVAATASENPAGRPTPSL